MNYTPFIVAVDCDKAYKEGYEAGRASVIIEQMLKAKAKQDAEQQPAQEGDGDAD